MHTDREQTQKSVLFVGGIAFIAVAGLIYTGIASCFTGETKAQSHKISSSNSIKN